MRIDYCCFVPWQSPVTVLRWMLVEFLGFPPYRNAGRKPQCPRNSLPFQCLQPELSACHVHAALDPDLEGMVGFYLAVQWEC